MTVAILEPSLRPSRRAAVANDLDSAYHELSREHVKQPQRERIVDHIVRTRSGSAPFRFLGLPGMHWAAEKMLAERVKARAFVGIERDWATLEKSVPWMPGREKAFDVCVPMAHGGIDGFRKEIDVGRDRLSITGLHVELWHLVGLGDAWIRNHSTFRRKFQRFSAMWLDTFAPLGSFIEQTRFLGQHFNRDERVAPWAITFLVGRDLFDFDADGGPLERRVEALASHLNRSPVREFAVTDAWTYRSAGGCTMANVVGVSMPRRQEPSPAEEPPCP